MSKTYLKWITILDMKHYNIGVFIYTLLNSPGAAEHRMRVITSPQIYLEAAAGGCRL